MPIFYIVQKKKKTTNGLKKHTSVTHKRWKWKHNFILEVIQLRFWKTWLCVMPSIGRWFQRRWRILIITVRSFSCSFHMVMWGRSRFARHESRCRATFRLSHARATSQVILMTGRHFWCITLWCGTTWTTTRTKVSFFFWVLWFMIFFYDKRESFLMQTSDEKNKGNFDIFFLL